MDEVLHNVVLAIWCNLLDPCWCTGHAGDQDSIGFLVLAGTVSGWCSFFFFFYGGLYCWSVGVMTEVMHLIVDVEVLELRVLMGFPG
jgi:hypothetical protein